MEHPERGRPATRDESFLGRQLPSTPPGPRAGSTRGLATSRDVRLASRHWKELHFAGWDHELSSISEQQWVAICERVEETTGPFTGDSARRVAMDLKTFSDAKVRENWVRRVRR
jgi:hypothetical protein